MVRYRVTILSSAYRDINKIITHILTEYQDVFAASNIANGFYDKIQSLEYVPQKIRFDNKYYFTKAKKYKIFYYIIGRDVYVARIFHSLQIPHLD